MLILHQDPRFIVLNKPAGLAVHSGPGGGSSVEDCFPQLSRRRRGPWLAHRLDADTAGCLVVALRRAALLAAQQVFANGLAQKTYWAIVRGRPGANEGQVDTPLAKRTDRAGWRMVAAPGGATALTEWRVLGEAEGVSWLELHPRTGRTHQVRAHCAALGCPVLGDKVYGGGGEPLHLLARAIRLPLEPPLAATAPVPPHMRHRLRLCGGPADPPSNPPSPAGGDPSETLGTPRRDGSDCRVKEGFA